MSRRKETRQERTQRFRDEVNDAYFLRIVDFIEKHKDDVTAKELIFEELSFKSCRSSVSLMTIESTFLYLSNDRYKKFDELT